MQREKAPGALDSPVFRNEWKHLISSSDRAQLRTRLSAVAYPDPHAIDGRYKIRSLYFDTVSDRVLREKIDGVSVREKFRIRCYNDDTSVIFLEKKCKQSGAGYKLQTRLTREQAGRIVKGDIDWMRESGDGLLVQLYSKMRGEGLHPKTIVDYTREPFIYPAGNVRVTIDYDIRTGLWATDFLNLRCLTILAAGLIPLAVFGSVVIGITLLLFANRRSSENPYIIVVTCQNADAEKQAETMLAASAKKLSLKSKSVRAGQIELNYELRLKGDETGFVSGLSELSGVESAVLVSYNGDYLS